MLKIDPASQSKPKPAHQPEQSLEHMRLSDGDKHFLLTALTKHSEWSRVRISSLARTRVPIDCLVALVEASDEIWEITVPYTQPKIMSDKISTQYRRRDLQHLIDMRIPARESRVTIALVHLLLNHQHCYPAHTQAHNHPEQPAAPISFPFQSLFLFLSLLIH